MSDDKMGIESLNYAEELAKVLNEKTEELFSENVTIGTQGMAYQILASFILSHCLIIIQSDKSYTQKKKQKILKILIEETIKKAFEMAELHIAKSVSN